MVAQKTGVIFVGRISGEAFNNPTIPSYKDLLGVKLHLQGMIDGDES